MSVIEWPHPDLAPRVIDMHCSNPTRSAGESITGFEQVAEAITQRWLLSLDFNNLKRHTVLPYRAMIGALRGRANAIRVPMFDAQFWPGAEELYLGTVPFSDGTPFGDGTEFATSDISGVVASCSLGEKSVTIDFGSYGQVLQPGQYFGLGAEGYLVTSIFWSGNVATILFEPGARRDYVAAAVTLRPTLVMRKVADDGGRHALEWGLQTSPRLDLEEVLPDELEGDELP